MKAATEETVEDVAKSILFAISSTLGMRGMGHGRKIYGAYEDCTIKFKCGFIPMLGWVENLTIRSKTGSIRVHSEQLSLPVGALAGDDDINEGKVVSMGHLGITKADLEKVRTALEDHKVKTIGWTRAFLRSL
jgi:hypothetical protein